MFKNKSYFIFIGLVVGGIFGYSMLSTKKESPKVVEQAKQQTSDYYRVSMARLRYAKDVSLKEEKESPIEDRKAFKGLKYFEADTNFCMSSVFEKTENAKKIKVSLTGGETEDYEPAGKATFALQGQTVSLTVFKSVEEGKFFVPFKDTTNPTETYGGGRYLDIAQENLKGNILMLDFNLAYNPFCAYSHHYTCPIPPKENHLPVAIRAGEKVF